MTAPILMSVFPPLLCALGLPFCGPRMREFLTLLITLSVLASVLTVFAEAQMFGHVPQTTLWSPVPKVSLAFAVEPLGLLFALMASILWVVSTIYTIGYLRANQSQNQKRFYACFVFALGCTMGIAMAKNLFTLFIFYELLTLSTWPLVAHKENQEARRGGRIYLTYLLGSSVCFFLFAILWTKNLAGTLDFTTGGILEGHLSASAAMILLLLFAFGIGKAALMPLHGWLPAAMVAPTPVSALLHAVAVVKAGVFSLLKVGLYIFGIDFLRDTQASLPLLWIALASLLVASLVAVFQDNFKARLAYSTVSHLSYVTLGLALATPLAIAGAILHMVMHAVGKITLFMTAGIITTATNKTLVSSMQGLGRLLPITFTAYMAGALCVIGFPLFGGMWSKWILLTAATREAAWTTIAFLLTSTLLNIIYLLPLGFTAFFQEPEEKNLRLPLRQLALCVIALCVTASWCVLLFFMTEPILSLITPVAEGTVR